MTISVAPAGGTSSPAPGRPLLTALRRRPRLRAGLLQILYVAAGVVLGMLIPRISIGPTISASQVDLVFTDIGVALIALVSVVYTLLFLNVQFAATTYSPRLNMFRDSQLVWHAQRPRYRSCCPAFDTGIERTFEQDPSLALRLLNHIGLRALSPAVNDPYTAIQALDSIEALLRRLAIQQLDLGAVTGADGRARIRLTMPGWEDFVSAGLDELIHTGTATRRYGND